MSYIKVTFETMARIPCTVYFVSIVPYRILALHVRHQTPVPHTLSCIKRPYRVPCITNLYGMSGIKNPELHTLYHITACMS